MKYCTKCGTQLPDDARFCSVCGAAQADGPSPIPAPVSAPAPIPAQKESTLGTVAFVFMIISCVMTGFFLIPLCWTIPMTVWYSSARKVRPVGMGFKVCTLLFVSLIAGILMLVDDEFD